MARPKRFIDGLWVNWGDDLFYPPVRPTKTPTSKPLGWANIIMPDKPAAIRAQITRTTQKTPEVMVKITSKMGAGKGMAAIANHLDYISRNGKVQLEDHEGRLLNSRADVKDIKNDWAQDISEVTKRRETINVIFSMAKGTPAAEVKEAVSDYLKQEFGGKHEYVFALHTDTDNPHVHVCIKMASIKKRSKRLNPRKNDLQRWREGFAQSLRKYGIAANATPRKTRGVAQQPSHQYQLHQSARQQHPISRKSAKLNFEAHTKEIHAWANIANVLAKSEDLSDRALAKEVVAFMAEQPIQQVGNISVQKSNDDISIQTEQLSTGIKLKKRQEQLSK
jgi:hypothetical protein